MDIRNVTKARTGGFDLEVRHPKLGWIPFTARKDDPEPHGKRIFDEAKRRFDAQEASGE